MTITVPVPGFDTLSYARRLKAAGVDEVQAEAHAEAVRDAITQNVATKADLDNLEARLEKRFADVETRTEKRFAALETRIEKRFAGLETQFEKRFANLETQFEKRFAALEVRLVRLVFAVAAGQAALIVALLKLLP